MEIGRGAVGVRRGIGRVANAAAGARLRVGSVLAVALPVSGLAASVATGIAPGSGE